MSENNSNGQKQPLFSKKGLYKMMFCRLVYGFNGLFHILLLAGLVCLLPEDLAWYVGGGLYLMIILLILVGPYVLHVLYISFFKLGYVQFNTSGVEISTKVRKKEFAFGAVLDIRVVGHTIKYSNNPVYYVVKMAVEQNGTVEKINLFTNNLSTFDPVVGCFRRKE